MSLASALLPPWAELESGLRIGLALMIGLGIATAIVTRLRRPVGTGSLRAQVTSWWWLLPPVFLAWAVRPTGLVVLVVVMSLLAAADLARLAGRPASRLAAPGLLVALILQCLLLARGWALACVVAMSVLALVLFATWRAAPGARREALLLALFATQAAGLGCLAALALAGLPRVADWCLYLCIVTALNDIGQYLAGTFLGRHKMSLRISPNKTWQGFGGGLAASTVFSLAIGHALGLATWPWLAGMGLVLSVAGLVGDLLFSAGKRALGIKDYSALIPGHGGILDRVDSLVLTAPVLLLALHLA
ncbi:MAG: phosphatidate cytidylyltransferase [Burkholderiaceae bacterium]